MIFCQGVLVRYLIKESHFFRRFWTIVAISRKFSDFLQRWSGFSNVVVSISSISVSCHILTPINPNNFAKERKFDVETKFCEMNYSAFERCIFEVSFWSGEPVSPHAAFLEIFLRGILLGGGDFNLRGVCGNNNKLRFLRIKHGSVLV